MIDFHSHILPGIDDGSQHVQDSLEMLRRLKEQGVNTVILTPHFYPNRHSLDKFLYRRQSAWERLNEALPDHEMRLLLGAEVQYYRGISHMEQLTELCVQGTNLLLLEMPFSRWSEYAVREVCELASSGEVTVLLAHIERYLAFQSRAVWERLLRCGVLMQSNAEFFLTPVLRRRALQMLKQARIHVLGTDTHNLTTRAPHMDAAMAYITRHLGDEFGVLMDRCAHEILENSTQ